MSSEINKVQCVFCTISKTEKLLIFSKETLVKCRNILRLRKLHNLKYNDIILPEDIFDAGYHSSCYKTFTALKKKNFLADANKEIPLQSTSSSAIEQPSTSANSSIIDDTMVQDSILNDVNIPKTDEVVEKNIDVAVDQSFEEIQFEDSAEPLTVQNSDTVATGNPDFDEAHFWLNGYVNKQNCRIWSEANPQVYVETPLHPEKLTVWCALWAGGIILQKR
ncbi:uncharacterized protein TNCV_4734771 [Trichonephila clavipes]|nr:uncharacterized protein TNCV_4734771 [Trichonephila clavipes]